VGDATVNTNMGDWIPQWCFPFINWALKKQEGRCSLKLDWFAGKEITPATGATPQVIPELREGDAVLSDHDPIVLDFVL
jgi:hypothetical protein